VKNHQTPPVQSFLLSLPISIVSCPSCSSEFDQPCETLNAIIQCPNCNRQLIYIDGFLHHYRRRPDIFIDSVHPLPIAPGFTMGGEISVISNELQVITFDASYNRPPEVFFLSKDGEALRDLLLENHYIAAVSISSESFILLSRTLDRELDYLPPRIRWMAVGEIGEHEKPVWINILQNAADLILKSEDRAAFVMLQIALDFYYDAVLGQLKLGSRDVKTASRRWKMSDRRAKIRLLENYFGRFPRNVTNKLVDLAEMRNRVVHGKIEHPKAHILSAKDAFNVIIEAIVTTNDLKYAYFKRENITIDNENDD